MSDIPEDIDKRATDIVRAQYGSGDDPEWELYKAIAQALMEEREAQRERSGGIQAMRYNGLFIIVHQEFPPHVWDGKEMKPLGCSYPNIDENAIRAQTRTENT